MGDVSPANIHYLLYTDGGSEGSQIAAGAAIVREPLSGLECRATIFLGSATNNEAEIAGGLLGFSLLKCLIAEQGLRPSVRWFCDSEYVLKSATQYIVNWQKNGWRTVARKPVKNQGLWLAYLDLSSGFNVAAEHVPGHSGHIENESCDRLVNWTRDWAARQGAGAFLSKVSLVGAGAEGQCIVVDGRDFICGLRRESQERAEYYEGIVHLLRDSGLLGEKGLSCGNAEGFDGEEAAERDLVLEQIVKQLRDLGKDLRSLRHKSARARRLEVALEKMFKEFGED